MIRAQVTVTLKSSVLDPQGKAVKHALEALGFRGIHDVRMGKSIEILLDGTQEAARQQVDRMCQKLLANTVVESYRIEVSTVRKPARPAAARA
jgi:phosphoribosylformylglycinamidine synthase